MVEKNKVASSVFNHILLVSEKFVNFCIVTLEESLSPYSTGKQPEKTQFFMLINKKCRSLINVTSTISFIKQISLNTMFREQFFAI